MDTGPTYSVGDPNMPGALICKSENRVRAGWRFANGDFFQDITERIPENDFQQIRTRSTDIPSVTRLSRSSVVTRLSSVNRNGLWTCRVQVADPEEAEEVQEVLDNFVFVGLYDRGRGKITVCCIIEQWYVAIEVAGFTCV